MKPTEYSQGDHKLTSLTNDLLKNNINKIFFETGTNTGFGVKTAIESGFKTIYSIDIEERYYEMSLNNFTKNKLYNDITFKFYLGDSGLLLNKILEEIEEKVTFWLDGHEFHKVPLLKELEAIKNHKIKEHTILIDDVRMFDKQEWDNIGLNNILNKIKEINPNYNITFIDSVNGKNDILVAKII